MSDFGGLVVWVCRQVTERAQGALPAAYVTFCPKEGVSYPQRSRLDLDGLADLEAAVTDRVRDLLDSADAEDRVCTRVRVRLYAVKGSSELDSRTFRVQAGADDTEQSTTREGELVGVVRELRMIVKEQSDTVQLMAKAAFTVTHSSLQLAAEAQTKAAEATGALVIAEGAARDDWAEIRAAVAQMLPAAAQLVMSKVAAGS